jgi:ribosomal protein S9
LETATKSVWIRGQIRATTRSNSGSASTNDAPSQPTYPNALLRHPVAEPVVAQANGEAGAEVAVSVQDGVVLQPSAILETAGEGLLTYQQR